jgi:nucleoid DNA-binding protein
MAKGKKKTNKPELIAHMQKAGFTPEMTTTFLDQLRLFISDNLKADTDVTLPTIGKISADMVAPRVGRNPRTGEEYTIEERLRYRFTVSKNLRESVEGV